MGVNTTLATGAHKSVQVAREAIVGIRVADDDETMVDVMWLLTKALTELEDWIDTHTDA